MPWTIDPTHTVVGFSAKHLGIATVRGSFTQFRGEIELDDFDPTTASGRIEVDTRSVDTGNEQRDAHLRSADFFDADNYPVMVFVPKSITPKAGAEYEVVGDLTIRGVTREVTLTYEHSGTVLDPWGGTRVGGSITGTVNRTDWGLKWNLPLGSGGLAVSEKVKIEVEGELVQSQEEAAAEAAIEAA